MRSTSVCVFGLIFAGANGELTAPENSSNTRDIKQIDNYGVANPISDVLSKLKIDLDI